MILYCFNEIPALSALVSVSMSFRASPTYSGEIIIPAFLIDMSTIRIYVIGCVCPSGQSVDRLSSVCCLSLETQIKFLKLLVSYTTPCHTSCLSCEVSAACSALFKLILREVWFSSFGCNKKHSQFLIFRTKSSHFSVRRGRSGFWRLKIFTTDTGKLRVTQLQNKDSSVYICNWWLLVWHLFNCVPASGENHIREQTERKKAGCPCCNAEK